jgi:hypothetical protein
LELIKIQIMAESLQNDFHVISLQYL